MLERIDQQIEASDLQSLVVELAMEKMGPDLRENEIRLAIFFASSRAVEDVAGSLLFASSDLYADFYGIRGLDGIRWSSKSTLDRVLKYFGAEQLRIIHELLLEIADNDDCVRW